LLSLALSLLLLPRSRTHSPSLGIGIVKAAIGNGKTRIGTGKTAIGTGKAAIGTGKRRPCAFPGPFRPGKPNVPLFRPAL
jgi:hypothetical protein